MKYVRYDQQSGLPVAYYDDEIHAEIPDDAVQLTDAQWQDCIYHPGQRKIDADSLTPIPYVPSIDGAAYKISYAQRIDAVAEEARLQFITPGDGQALVYLGKETQARACLSNYDLMNPPPAGMYSALDAEIGVTGDDTLSVAQVVVGLADAWGSIADQIETLRLTAKKTIDNVPFDAPDLEAQLAAIAAGIIWPTP